MLSITSSQRARFSFVIITSKMIMGNWAMSIIDSCVMIHHLLDGGEMQTVKTEKKANN